MLALVLFAKKPSVTIIGNNLKVTYYAYGQYFVLASSSEI